MSQCNSLNRRGFFKTGLAGLALAGSSQITTAAHAAAPKKGPAGGQFHRFNLGGFEVTTLRDGSFSVDTVQGILARISSSRLLKRWPMKIICRKIA